MLTGTLRTDPTAKVIYLGVSDINLTQREIVAHGKKITALGFKVKGVAVISLFTGPAIEPATELVIDAESQRYAPCAHARRAIAPRISSENKSLNTAIKCWED